MQQGEEMTMSPRHLELRIQDYFINALNAKDTSGSSSPLSFVRTVPQTEIEFVDSLPGIPGDELIFRYRLFANPSSSLLDARVIDSTVSQFSVGDQALTMNEIPVISASEFAGMLSSSVTPLLKKGMNEMTMVAAVPRETRVNRLDHMIYFERSNTFGETLREKSNLVKVFVKGVYLPLLDTAQGKGNDLTGRSGPRKPTSLK
jgi:hypothetical protein